MEITLEQMQISKARFEAIITELTAQRDQANARCVNLAAMVAEQKERIAVLEAKTAESCNA